MAQAGGYIRRKYSYSPSCPARRASTSRTGPRRQIESLPPATAEVPSRSCLRPADAQPCQCFSSLTGRRRIVHDVVDGEWAVSGIDQENGEQFSGLGGADIFTHRVVRPRVLTPGLTG